MLRPQYDIAADYLKTLDIHLATVDCSDDFSGPQDSTCDGHIIQGWPTLRKYRGPFARFEEYEGTRTAEDIILFISGKACPVDVCPPRPPTTTNTIPPSRPNGGLRSDPSPNATHPNAVWLSDDRSTAVVKLLAPDLNYIHPLSFELDLNRPTSLSVLLNFSISSDGKHVTLNGDLLALQVPEPSIPPHLRAVRIPSDWPLDPSDLIFDLVTDFTQATVNAGHLITELDYYLSARNRDDPNIRYYNYHPEIWLGIIGAGTPGLPTETKLLVDSQQKMVKILLYDHNEGGSSDAPKRHYAIERVTFEDRLERWHGRPPRPDDVVCNLWSWRCADIGDPPWYRYIWRQNFDNYGRIGCLRREYLMWKATITQGISFIPWPVWMVCAIVVFWRVSVRLRLRRRRGEMNFGFGKTTNLIK